MSKPPQGELLRRLPDLRLFFGYKFLGCIAAASLHFEINLIRGYLAAVLQVDTVAEVQVNGERNIITADLTVLNWLLELIAAHRACEFPSLGLQFERDAVGVAIWTWLVAGPNASRVGSHQNGRGYQCHNENALDHGRHYMANCR